MRKALDVYSMLKDNNLSYELIYTLIIINNFHATETSYYQQVTRLVEGEDYFYKSLIIA